MRLGWSPEETWSLLTLARELECSSTWGVTDEGEPWWSVCTPSGDPMLTIALTDATYVAYHGPLERPIEAPTLAALYTQLANQQEVSWNVPIQEARQSLLVRRYNRSRDPVSLFHQEAE